MSGPSRRPNFIDVRPLGGADFYPRGLAADGISCALNCRIVVVSFLGSRADRGNRKESTQNQRSLTSNISRMRPIPQPCKRYLDASVHSNPRVRVFCLRAPMNSFTFREAERFASRRVHRPGFNVWVPSCLRFPWPHCAPRLPRWVPWSRQWKLWRARWPIWFRRRWPRVLHLRCSGAPAYP